MERELSQPDYKPTHLPLRGDWPKPGGPRGKQEEANTEVTETNYMHVALADDSLCPEVQSVQQLDDEHDDALERECRYIGPIHGMEDVT